MPSRRGLSRDDSFLMAKYCASVNLRRAARLVTRHYDANLSAVGITATQLPLLAAVNTGPGSSISELAETLDLERSTISREIASLVERGFVKMKTGSDKRATVLELTAAGHAKLAEAFRAWRRAHDAIVGAYGEAAFDDLLSRAHDLGRKVGTLHRKERD